MKIFETVSLLLFSITKVCARSVKTMSGRR